MTDINFEAINPADKFDFVDNKAWKWLLGTGIFTIILGCAAVLLPFITTLTVQILLAAVFIIAGITYLLYAFQSRKTKGFLIRTLLGVLYGLAGFMLVFFPLSGAFTLTVILAFLFMLSGAFKVALGFYIRPLSSWGWLVFNGSLSIILGILIWMGLPGTAFWIIGFLVGIELFLTGLAMTMYGLSIKNT
jgi:uncharacterized membrane protein HdeD (DUF308 family)